MDQHRGEEIPSLTQKGSLTVEAALVIPVIFVVMMAMMELVGLVATRLELVAAAREGARVAATTPDPASAAAAAREALGGELGSRVAISVRRPSVVGEPATVEVRVAKPLITPLLNWITVPLSARAVMRVER